MKLTDKLFKQDGKYHCPKCSYNNPVKADIKKHLIRKHKMTKYICRACNFDTSYKKLIIKHIRTCKSQQESDKEDEDYSTEIQVSFIFNEFLLFTNVSVVQFFDN